MISRGYYLGEIIDSLSGISQQVETRCVLGLFDLNKYLEDFFLYILNEALDLHLKNFNENRCNAPGVDLIDTEKNICFQVTSTKTSQKVKHTLEVVKEMEPRPAEVNILIIGKAQTSYSLDSSLCEELKFSPEKNIWDINSLCKKLIEVPIDRLQKIYDYVRKELARINIELEIPNENGEYATTIRNYVEQIPEPMLTDFSSYYTYHRNTQGDGYKLSQEDVNEDFLVFIKELSKLPRITRDLFAFLLERRDQEDSSDTYFIFNYEVLKRICRFPDLDGELKLLREHGFADIHELDSGERSPQVRVFCKGVSDYFGAEFVEFTEENRIRFTEPIVKLDFSKY